MAMLCCLSAPPMLSRPKITSGCSPAGGGSGLRTVSSSGSNRLMTMRSYVTRRSFNSNNQRTKSLVVCMAPEEEKMTRRSPLDFPIEWERPKPGRRPDIFPQFSPMKTPLPPPLPADPPEEDEEEEEEKKEEEEDDPEKEEPENPDKQ